MGMLDLLRGKKPAAAPGQPRPAKNPAPPSTEFGPSQLSQHSPASVHSVRKDLLRLVLRETLNRNGIPQDWVSADMLRTTNSRREQGIHVRFLVRHWDPRLLVHGVALEQDFTDRLLLLDPQARSWLMGFSWQFAMADSAGCPPLPHPGAWTASSGANAAPASPETRPGDIIAGPVVIPQPAEDVRGDLERLLALRDEDLKRHGQGGDNFAPTRPASL